MTSFPVTASQILTAWSSLIDASRAPSGLQATPPTLSVGPSRVRISLPVVASQILTVQRAPTRAAKRVPVGHQETDHTEPVSAIMRMGFPVAASQITIVP